LKTVLIVFTVPSLWNQSYSQQSQLYRQGVGGHALAILPRYRRAPDLHKTLQL